VAGTDSAGIGNVSARWLECVDQLSDGDLESVTVVRVTRGPGLASDAASADFNQISMEICSLVDGPYFEIGKESQAAEGLDKADHVLAIARPLLGSSELERDVRDLGSHDSSGSWKQSHAADPSVEGCQAHRFSGSDEELGEGRYEELEAIRVLHLFVSSPRCDRGDCVGHVIGE
jgi:hypothetical protein